jgi:hypothetical protein
LPHRRYHDVIDAPSQSHDGRREIELGLEFDGIQILRRLRDAANKLCCKRFGANFGCASRLGLVDGCAAPDRRRSLRQRLPLSGERAPNRSGRDAK